MWVPITPLTFRLLCAVIFLTFVYVIQCDLARRGAILRVIARTAQLVLAVLAALMVVPQ